MAAAPPSHAVARFPRISQESELISFKQVCEGANEGRERKEEGTIYVFVLWLKSSKVDKPNSSSGLLIQGCESVHTHVKVPLHFL